MRTEFTFQVAICTADPVASKTLSISQLWIPLMSRRLAAVAQALLSSLVVTTLPMGAGAQVEAPFQNREEREIYGDTNGSGSILDAANPMDLLNQIRRATAMDDATPPSDAIDAALKAYQNPPATP
ncbi:hypothetical protein SynM161_00645 [Synechococcus sp. M16.1]|nr:hypothetical protein SynM161_00645 [Synechococcus sp. M16.1]